jgi:hypothetical protein
MASEVSTRPIFLFMKRLQQGVGGCISRGSRRLFALTQTADRKDAE